MRSFIYAAVATLALGVSAAPGVSNNTRAEVELVARDNCLNDKRAQAVANNFQALIANYSDTLANATLTTDFTDYSDSVNTLIDGGCSGPVTVRPLPCWLDERTKY